MSRAARGAALLGAIAGLAALPTSASAWTPGQLPPYFADGVYVDENLAPEEALQEFARCPRVSEFGEGVQPIFCLKLIAYDGELKLGKTVAKVADPIEVVVGVGQRKGDTADPNNTVVLPGSGAGGGPAPVKISGGILGLKQLDPLLAFDPIGLLSLSATPQMGTAGVASDGVGFLRWLQGSDNEAVKLSLPLSIKLNNLLLGDRCQIPQFTINLTNTTTEPPAGTPPIAGSNGTSATARYQTAASTPTFTQQHFTRLGTELVDNTFAIAPARGCDLLVGGLLKQPKGLLDSVVNAQAGLPAAAGTNYARFKVDTVSASYGTGVYGGTILGLPGLRTQVPFGDVAVGQSAERDFTVKNRSAHPDSYAPTLAAAVGRENWSIAEDGCSGKEIAPNETCTVKVRFAPTTTGTKRVSLNFNPQGANSIGATFLSGTGTEPTETATATAADVKPEGTTASAPPATSTPAAAAPTCKLVRLKLLGTTICL